jgi:hypothetical protein
MVSFKGAFDNEIDRRTRVNPGYAKEQMIILLGRHFPNSTFWERMQAAGEIVEFIQDKVERGNENEN